MDPELDEDLNALAERDRKRKADPADRARKAEWDRKRRADPEGRARRNEQARERWAAVARGQPITTPVQAREQGQEQ